MGTLPLAAYSIAYSLEPVCFMLPIGLSTALSNSVGNQLGANRVVAAKKLAITGIGVGLLVVLLYLDGIIAILPVVIKCTLNSQRGGDRKLLCRRRVLQRLLFATLIEN